MAPDELAKVLFVHIYNYKTKQYHIQRLCIGMYDNIGISGSSHKHR